jgi:membrane-associated protease RseP (regulator of RpoE activity)
MTTQWAPPDNHERSMASAALPEPYPGSPWAMLAVAAALAAIGIFYSWSAFIFVMGLIVCIFLHECGHYWAAKRAGMKVTQFFLFFGPRLWSFKRGETEYGVRALPLGAFVKVPGMHNMDTDVEPEDEPRTYRQAPFHSRFLMAAAGSLMHFAIALVLLLASLIAVGRARDPNAWQIDAVAPGGAAVALGLQPGDRIVGINGTGYTDLNDVIAFIRSHPNEQASFLIQRGGSQVTATGVIGVSDDPCRPGGRLGILNGPGNINVQRVNPVTAVGKTFVEFGAIARDSVAGLGKIFSPSGLKTYGKAVTTGCNTDQRLLSPIGAAKIGGSYCRNLGDCLVLLGAVNIFIGLVNWFPMLPFDGGHMVIAAYEKLRSRRGRRYRVDVGRFLPVTYALVALLLLLSIGNIYLDLRS